MCHENFFGVWMNKKCLKEASIFWWLHHLIRIFITYLSYSPTATVALAPVDRLVAHPLLFEPCQPGSWLLTGQFSYIFRVFFFAFVYVSVHVWVGWWVGGCGGSPLQLLVWCQQHCSCCLLNNWGDCLWIWRHIKEECANAKAPVLVMMLEVKREEFQNRV